MTNFSTNQVLQFYVTDTAELTKSLDGKIMYITDTAKTFKTDNITNVMNYLNIKGGVDGVISGDDVVVPKPSPDCFLRAMDIVGATPEETIIFEDSEIGLAAAKCSGASYVRINFDNLL